MQILQKGVSSTLKCSECESHPCEKVGTACYNAIRGDGFDAGREKVLDELEQWARDAYVRRNGKAGYFATYENIHDKIEQLRKGEQK